MQMGFGVLNIFILGFMFLVPIAILILAIYGVVKIVQNLSSIAQSNQNIERQLSEINRKLNEKES